MGRLTKLHRERLDNLLEELDHVLDELGKPFIPELQDRVLAFMQTFVDDVEAGKMKPSSFLKNSYGHFWREISDLIAIKFPDLHRPLPRKTDNRTKAPFYWDRIYCHDVLFKFDSYNKIEETDLYQKVSVWRTECNERSDAETVQRQGEHFEWGETEYDRLHALALDCLHDKSRSRNDNERCVQLIFALSFFTGRRPWEEVGRISVFKEADAPDGPASEHADDWLLVDGIGKKGAGREETITIPVFNISSIELVEALVELRLIQMGKTWFDGSRNKWSTASTDIIGSLGYQMNKFCRAHVDECFERSIQHGYNFDHNKSKGKGHSRFTTYDLRRMYCSYGFWRYNQWARENQYKCWDDAVPWAKMYLGHSEGKTEKHTRTYLGFTYRGEEPLRDINGLKSNPFSVRHEVTD